MWEKLFSYKLRSFPRGIKQKFLRRSADGLEAGPVREEGG
jgi:hypothetical protein